MSLSTKWNDHLACLRVQIAQRLATVAQHVAPDCQQIENRHQKNWLTRLFGRRLRGAWAEGDKTLTYTLGRDEISLGLDYHDLVKNMYDANPELPHMACRTAICDYIAGEVLPSACARITSQVMTRCGATVKASDAYRRVHAACAAADKRVELQVVVMGTGSDACLEHREYWIESGRSVVVTPRLVVQVYLDQPYSASSDAGLSCAKPTAPAVPRGGSQDI